MERVDPAGERIQSLSRHGFVQAEIVLRSQHLVTQAHPFQ